MLDLKCIGLCVLCVCVCVCVCVCGAAVQEERQRGKERGESEVESTSSFNEEMPVDKILDAELAVEPKTETYSDGSPSNSVSITETQHELAEPINYQSLFYLLRGWGGR